MNNDWIAAAALEIVEQIDGGKLENIADIIRRHATPEAVAMPKCVDCGAATKVYKNHFGGDTFPGFRVACTRCNVTHTLGEQKGAESEAIAAYARLCVRKPNQVGVVIKTDTPVPPMRHPEDEDAADTKPAASRCHVCKAAVGEPHAWHCSVSPGVFVGAATKPPEPNGDTLPPCCLCGKLPNISHEHKIAQCGNNDCECLGRTFTLESWTRLHAPNRLTMPTRFGGGTGRAWPVVTAGGTIIALCFYEDEAGVVRAMSHNRRVLDPIDVEVTVKP